MVTTNRNKGLFTERKFRVRIPVGDLLGLDLNFTCEDSVFFPLPIFLVCQTLQDVYSEL